MKVLFTIVIFCVVLFVYLHIYFHLKVSDDLEVFEIDQPSKDKLEEICDLRQPVIFDYSVGNLLSECNSQSVLRNYGAFDVKIRNVKEYDDVTELYMPLTLSAASDVFEKDTYSRFISENNYDFLEETGLTREFRCNDIFLRPNYVSNCIYDIMFGSNNTETPLRYELNYRNYFLVTKGSIKIKLIPPKSSKYLYTIKDYDNFEFLSPVNPWNVQNQFKADFDKIKTLEVEIRTGQIIYIPAYWWYSIKFEKNSSICAFKYKTYMNNVAIADHLLVNILQGQNVKRHIAKKKDIIEVNGNEPLVNDPSENEKSIDTLQNHVENTTVADLAGNIMISDIQQPT